MRTHLGIVTFGIVTAMFSAPRAHAQGYPFDGCGQLILDPDTPGCVLFHSDEIGFNYELDHRDGFTVGDRIHVRGVVAELCVLPCANQDACMYVSSITLCDAGFADCGRLVQSGTCLIFLDSAGANYVLDEYGGFGDGASVFVVGQRVPCANPCGDCIHVQSIRPCFAECGLLVPRLEGCILFRTDAGVEYQLDNLGDFHIGDRVYVVGGSAPPCSPICGVPCIHDNRIRTCSAPGDANCDARIDENDVPAMVTALLNLGDYATRYPNCPLATVDVNRDGIVDALDIQLFVNILLGT